MNKLLEKVSYWPRMIFIGAMLFGPIFAASAVERDGLVIPFRKVSLSSPVQGLVAELQVQEGDTVEENQIVARLQDDEERFDLQRLELILEKRQFDADASDRLLADNLISAEEAMEKRIELAVGKVQVAAAQFALERKQIRTPLGGVIVARNREAGEWVNPGDILFEVVLMDPIHVEVLLDGREGIRLRRGSAVTVRVPDLEGFAPRSAVIDFVDPRIDASSGLMKVRVLLENPDLRILPGMQARVSFSEQP